MGDLDIENNEFQEENKMLKNDSIDLNKYNPEKYRKLELQLKNLIRKRLQNNIFGINYKEKVFSHVHSKNRNNKVLLIINE
jgi:hypothetical protein